MPFSFRNWATLFIGIAIHPTACGNQQFQQDRREFQQELQLMSGQSDCGWEGPGLCPWQSHSHHWKGYRKVWVSREGMNPRKGRQEQAGFGKLLSRHHHWPGPGCLRQGMECGTGRLLLIFHNFPVSHPRPSKHSLPPFVCWPYLHWVPMQTPWASLAFLLPESASTWLHCPSSYRFKSWLPSGAFLDCPVPEGTLFCFKITGPLSLSLPHSTLSHYLAFTRLYFFLL